MTAFSDKAAQTYDKRIERLVPGYRLALELMASSLAAHRPQPMRILVPGCGTGSELLAVATLLSKARFTAADPSEGMLAMARRKAKADGSDARIDFHHGMIEELSDGVHDAAMLCLVLHFLPDNGRKHDLLAGIAARLRQGALFLLVDAIETCDGDEALADWLRRKGHSASEGAEVIERMRRTWHRLTEERLYELLAEAGFSVREPFFRSFGYLGILAIKA